MANKALILIIFLLSICHADFLGLDVVEKEEPSPNFVYGTNYSGRIFAGGLDNFGGLNVRYRISRNFAAGAKSEFDFTRSGFVAGGFLHYLPSGKLHKELAENFWHLGVDYIRIDSEQSPLFSAGYGRDMLPWKKSPFGFRAIGRVELAPRGHTFSREEKGIFGLETTTITNIDFAFEIGVFMYM